MKTSKDECLKALTNVKPGIAGKEIIEQSTSFVFKDSRAIAYNDRIMVSHPFPVDLNGAISAEELFSLLSKVTDEEISMTQKDDLLHIKGWRFKAEIAFQVEVNLPIGEIPMPKKWLSLPKGFSEAIGHCHKIASTDMSKMGLTNISIRQSYVEACDGYRAMKHEYESDGKALPKKPLQIPAMSAKELARHEITKYGLTDGWAHFKAKDKTIFSCRLGMGEYPETSKIFEGSEKGALVKFPDELDKIINRAVVLADKDDVTNDCSVKISVEKDKLTISSESAQGKFQETCKVDSHRKDFEFSIDPETLVYVLKHISKAKLSSWANGGKRLGFRAEKFSYVVALIVENSTKK